MARARSSPTSSTSSAAQGLDQVRRLLGDVFGTAPANKAMDSLTERVEHRARNTGQLSVTKPAGLIVGTTASATPVRANTFFGDRRDANAVRADERR